MRKLYIAGPDVFRQDWMSYAEQVVAACSVINCEALLPIPVNADLYAADVRGVTVDGNGLDADRVFESCMNSVAQADIVIANINPFRGDEPDSGTVFEIATAYAMNKPVIGYTADRRMTGERYQRGNRTKNGAILCDAGYFVERFNLPCNVMVAKACKKIVYGDVFDAIKTVHEIMDNRVLLEKAATAMGYQWSKNPEITHDGLWITKPSVNTYWNPLKHNSEAFDIAATLGFSIVHYPLRRTPKEFVTVQIHRMGDLLRETPVQYTEPYHDDPVAATRRAIVCCAAAFYDLQEGVVGE